MAQASRSGTYEIVVNDRREYAVWPSRRPLPAGWRYSGKSGAREELIAYLKSVCMDPVEVVPAPASQAGGSASQISLRRRNHGMNGGS